MVADDKDLERIKALLDAERAKVAELTQALKESEVEKIEFARQTLADEFFKSIASYVPSSIRRDVKLTLSAKLTLGYFISIYNLNSIENYEVELSNAFLAQELGVGINTVTRALKELSDSGHIALTGCNANRTIKLVSPEQYLPKKYSKSMRLRGNDVSKGENYRTDKLRLIPVTTVDSHQNNEGHLIKMVRSANQNGEAPNQNGEANEDHSIYTNIKNIKINKGADALSLSCSSKAKSKQELCQQFTQEVLAKLPVQLRDNGQVAEFVATMADSKKDKLTQAKVSTMATFLARKLNEVSTVEVRVGAHPFKVLVVDHAIESLSRSLEAGWSSVFAAPSQQKFTQEALLGISRKRSQLSERGEFNYERDSNNISKSRELLESYLAESSNSKNMFIKTPEGVC